MGVMDHKRTWEFRVHATPDACTAAFAKAMNGGSALGLMSSRWEIRAVQHGAVAAYQGRGGMMELMTGLSERATVERDSAVGSEVQFQASASPNGVTICLMHLKSFATSIGFTSDARFIRPAMQRVERALREVDPNLVVVKN